MQSVTGRTVGGMFELVEFAEEVHYDPEGKSSRIS